MISTPLTPIHLRAGLQLSTGINGPFYYGTVELGSNDG